MPESWNNEPKSMMIGSSFGVLSSALSLWDRASNRVERAVARFWDPDGGDVAEIHYELSLARLEAGLGARLFRLERQTSRDMLDIFV